MCRTSALPALRKKGPQTSVVVAIQTERSQFVISRARPVVAVRPRRVHALPTECKCSTSTYTVRLFVGSSSSCSSSESPPHERVTLFIHGNDGNAHHKQNEAYKVHAKSNISPEAHAHPCAQMLSRDAQDRKTCQHSAQH